MASEIEQKKPEVELTAECVCSPFVRPSVPSLSQEKNSWAWQHIPEISGLGEERHSRWRWRWLFEAKMGYRA